LAQKLLPFVVVDDVVAGVVGSDKCNVEGRLVMAEITSCIFLCEDMFGMFTGTIFLVLARFFKLTSQARI
jgi:hypothetical protein